MNGHARFGRVFAPMAFALTIVLAVVLVSEAQAQDAAIVLALGEPVRGPSLRMAEELRIGALEGAPEQQSPPTWRIAEEPTVSLGTLDGPPETLLTYPVDAAVLADGTVVVGLSGGNLFALRYFTREGEFIAEAGGHGDGPFELSRGFTSLIRLPGDSLLVVGMDHRFHLFGPRGEPVTGGRMDLPPLSFPVAHLDGRQVVLQTMRSEAPIPEGITGLRSDVLLYDLDGGASSTIGTYTIGRQKMVDGYGLALPFEPNDYLAAGGGRVWLASAEQGTIRTLRGAGADTITIALPHPPDRVDEAMRERWTSMQLERRSDARSARLIRDHLREVDFPRFTPSVQALDVDDEGNVWALRYEPSWSMEPYHWDVFAPDGRWIAEVLAPFALFGGGPRREQFSLVKSFLEIGADYVLVRTRDDLGVDRVKQYAIVR